MTKPPMSVTTKPLLSFLQTSSIQSLIDFIKTKHPNQSLITVESTATIPHVMNCLQTHNILSVPVFESSCLMGVIGISDILVWLINQDFSGLK